MNKKLYIIYIFIWLVTGLIALLSEKEVLPVEYLPHNANTDYFVSLLSIFSSIGGTYFALRLLAFKSFLKKISEADTAELAWATFCKWSYIRLTIIATAMWINVTLYYATSYYESIKYCLLIVMIAAVFCWPSKGEFENKRLSTKK